VLAALVGSFASCWMSYSGLTEILPEGRTTWLPEWLPRVSEMFELIS
jgi:hypothetical protein